jgi:hypothetical protein
MKTIAPALVSEPNIDKFLLESRLAVGIFRRCAEGRVLFHRPALASSPTCAPIERTSSRSRSQKCLDDKHGIRSSSKAISDLQIGHPRGGTGHRSPSLSFAECTSLTIITITNSAASIWPFAFCGCTVFASLMIGDSVIAIVDGTFFTYNHSPRVGSPN